MNLKLKKRLRLIIPLALALFFGWYTFSKLPVSTIIPFVKSANYWWIALGVFFGLLSHLSRAYRWKYLLEPMGYQIRFSNSIMAVFITYLANYGIPRSGEVLRAAVLTNYEDVPFEKSFGTIVAERIADLIVMLGIIAITLILEFDFIIELLQKSLQPKKLILLGSVGLVILIISFFIIKKSQSKFAVKIKLFLKGLMEGVLSVFKMKHKWAFIAHTLFIWGMYLLMFYVTTFALPDLNNVTIGAILVAFISASFTIATTNGGIFVYPVAVMAAFTVFGIAKDPSFAFGWIMWSSQTIMIIIAGSLSFIYLPIYNRIK
ncbi:lysylphosphatidylglycerol synthase transmembrane domain-containing protein [Psychroserpens luteus]|uniref:Lysylphosphatidylglycerol synthase transmembrane domain-containing protein n=1 Tax=Psychroserpens luteus TaxID=1434066 RepID=A0ABW5ZW20_9FLAO|nr:lysylphosphatidylglycerol synthase transmembrane domain-containing protein [Psychroserpens luteus]